MKKNTKTAFAAVSVAALVVLCILFIRSSLHMGKPVPPGWFWQQQEQKIDEESLTLITKTKGEWHGLGEKNGRYKNPETGEYTMLMPMTCQSCLATIALPPMDPTSPNAREERASCICPKCGKPAFN